MLRAAYPALKRALDIVVSVAALFVFSPLLLVVAIAVRGTMGAPVIFSQKRGGLHGTIFLVHKFRTMRDGEGTDKDRLTRLGRLLRASSLDELPELVNVLKGEMSLVGPRPFHAEYLTKYSQHQMRRHDVRPGISGLAQVRGRNLLSWEERFELDIQYVDRASMRLDLWILLETLRAVVKREGIAGDGEVTMSKFVGSA